MTRQYVRVAVTAALIGHASLACASNTTDETARPVVLFTAGGTLEDTSGLMPGNAADLGLSEADIRYFAAQAWSSAQTGTYLADASAQRAAPSNSPPPDLPPSEAPLPEPVSFAVLAVGLAGLYSLRRPKRR